MKFFLSLGGATGFLAAFFSALHAGSQLGYALRDGAMGCLAGAFILRAFYSVLLFCLKSLVQEQSSGDANSNPEKASAN